MLTTMSMLLEDAEKKSHAVGAFNVPTLEAVRAVIAAAEECNQPVIIQHAEVHEKYMPLSIIGPIMLDFAARASVPVAVHLDHGESFDICIQAMRMGFTSVMYDASSKPFETNVMETAEIVKIARALGVAVEAEIGCVLASAVGGGEGRSTGNMDDPEDCYTNPDDADLFVKETGVDALAISFGTVHGVYLAEPVLNMELVKKIKRRVKIPLVMHGGSGISHDDYEEAIRSGITKINYYTYMSMAGGMAVADYIEERKDGRTVFFHDISQIAAQAMKKNVEETIRVFSMK